MLKRKIAFLSLSESPPAPPANARVLETLAARFPDLELQPVYLLDHLRRRPIVVVLGALHALRYYCWDILRRRKKLKYCFFRTPYIFRAMKRIAFEQVDADSCLFTFQMQSIFDGSVLGLPHFVYTDHTHLENTRYADFREHGLYARAWIDCECEIYRNASFVFCRSSNVGRSLVDDYACDPVKVACVYAGSNAAIPAPDAQGGGRKTKRILFVGIDWERKGGPTLLAAFRKVLEAHPDAKLSIVGCAPDTGDLPGCEVFGRIPLGDVHAHFAKASVFCLPTRVEPFGIVFVEAMASGLPVVGTDVGAVPDMVRDGENGFLVPPNDPERLAARLIELIDAPETARRFGARGREIARDRYHWDSVGRRMRTEIERVLAATGR